MLGIPCNSANFVDTVAGMGCIGGAWTTRGCIHDVSSRVTKSHARNLRKRPVSRNGSRHQAGHIHVPYVAEGRDADRESETAWPKPTRNGISLSLHLSTSSERNASDPPVSSSQINQILTRDMCRKSISRQDPIAQDERRDTAGRVNCTRCTQIANRPCPILLC